MEIAGLRSELRTLKLLASTTIKHAELKQDITPQEASDYYALLNFNATETVLIDNLSQPRHQNQKQN